MKKNIIEFLCMQLLIDGQIALAKDFSTFDSTNVKIPRTNLGLNEVDIQKTDDYIWFSGRKGDCFPYSPEVVDIETQETTPNPKKTTQVELRNQWFAIYHYDSSMLYVSGNEKKTIVDIIKDKLKKRIIVKNIYKSRDKFLQELEKIKSIRFISTDDLLTEQTTLFEDTKNMLGLGMPKQIKMTIDYAYAEKTEQFKKFIKSLFSKYEAGEITHLVVVGAHMESDSLIESVFNIKNIGETITFFCENDENGMFSPETVKTKILEKFSIGEE